MSEQWRIESKPDYPTHYRFIVRGAETVAMAMSQEIAEHIINLHNAARAEDRRGLVAEVERYRMALEKIAKLSGRGTDGNIAELALHPEKAWMIGDWITNPEIVEDEAFCAALSNGSAAPDGGEA